MFFVIYFFYYSENRADSQRSVSHESLLFTPQVIANLTEEEGEFEG